MKRRVLRMVLVALGLVLFTGYFAFRTFFFDPLEGRYGPGLATLLPRDLDLYAGKRDLAADFDGTLRPSLAAALASHPAGQGFLASEDWRQFAEGSGLLDLEATVRAELERAQLPPGVDPLALFGGRELALGAYWNGPGQPPDWIALGRANWMGKLGVELLERPSWLGLEAQGLSAESLGGSVRLSGAQLPRPLFFGRHRDVVMVSTRADLVQKARDLEARKGQDSFGQSARYHDHVETRRTELLQLDRAPEPLEWHGDLPKLAAATGLPLAWPNPKSPEPPIVWASRLFQLGQLKDVSGVLSLGRALRLDAHGSVLGDQLSPLQRRVYRMRGFERGTVLNNVARLAPADTGLLVYAQSDLAGLLREWLSVQEPALRDNLVSQIVRPLFGANNVDALVGEFDAAFRDSVAFLLRPNDYPDMGPDGPPHNDTVVPAWTLALWVESREKIDELRQKVIQNQARFGIQGRTSGSGGVFTNEVQGGFVVYEYWSPAIQGTGHLATVNDAELFLISNSYQMIGQLLATYYQGGARYPRLSDQVAFQNLMQEGQASSSALLYVQPASMVETWKAMTRRVAQDDLLSSVDWAAKRAEFGKAVVAERFPGYLWGSLPAEIQDQVEVAVDQRVADYQIQLRESELPKRLDAVDSRFAWLTGLEGALVQARLTERTLDLALRALFTPAP